MVKLITPFRGKAPRIQEDAFIDCSARIIGDVIIEEGASVWPLVVVRADSATIRIGRRAAVLDLSLVEAPADHPVIIGDEALISHRAVIHGAEICSRSLVGIGAIILDGAVISSGSIIGAGSVVTSGMRVPPNSLVMGVPGTIVRETTSRERQLVLEQVRDLFAKSREYKLKEGH